MPFGFGAGEICLHFAMECDTFLCFLQFLISVEFFKYISVFSQDLFAQSSHLTELLWTNSGVKSGISVSELIASFKKKSVSRE